MNMISRRRTGLLVALCAAAAGLQVACGALVHDQNQLLTALRDQNQTSIEISGSIKLGAQASPVTISRPITISGTSAASVLDFAGASGLLLLGPGVALTFSSITLVGWEGPSNASLSLPAAQGTLAPVDASLGSLSLRHATLLLPGFSLEQLQARLSAWVSAASAFVDVLSGTVLTPAAPGRQFRAQAWASAGGADALTRLEDTVLLIGSTCCSTSQDTWVYDSPSFAAALKDQAVGRVCLFSNTTLSPLDLNYTMSIPVARDLLIHGCPNTRLDLNYAYTMFGVTVEPGIQVNMQGLQITSVTSVNRLFWPSKLNLLLSLFLLTPATKGVKLENCTVVSAPLDRADIRDRLQSFLGQGAMSPNLTLSTPTAPDGGPDTVLINSWDLIQGKWVCGEPTLIFQPEAPRNSTSKWSFRNVLVTQERANPCITTPGVIKVSSGRELRQMIQDPLIPSVEIINDITLVRSEWPPEANGPDKVNGTTINVMKKFEIKACHPKAGQRYTIDAGDIGQIIFAFNELTITGDLRIVNPRASPRRNWLYLLVGALSVEDNGIISFQGVEIVGNNTSPFHDPNHQYWLTPCSNTARGNYCHYFIPNKTDFVRGSYYDVLVHNYQFYKTPWVYVSQGRDIYGTGYWDYQNILLRWYNHTDPQPQNGTCALGPATATDDGDDNKGLAVGLGVGLGLGLGLLLLALLGLFVARSIRARRAAEDAEKGHSETLPTVNPGGSSQEKGNKEDGLGVLGSAGSLQGGSTVGGGGTMSTAAASMTTEFRIETIKHKLAQQGAVGMAEARSEQIQLTELLGEGTFGRVYKGFWRGTLVAVKTMVFPATMSGKEKREKMAIMETAISSSLSHPNVVQTYTYAVRPVMAGDAANKEEGPGASIAITDHTNFSADTSATNIQSWEVRLVLEFCDRGSLRDALNQHVFLRDGRVYYPAIVETALDVARAMLHLHSENIIHSDLKARNILLKTAGGDGRGFIAKVADFGLSLKIDPGETHVSNVFQGTMTHMAPELLLHGQISKASDVYAYGVLLWELYTAGHAFKGTPKALLGHEITKGNLRPVFPPDCPFEFQLLACRCWESDPAIRPNFEKVLDDLIRIQAKLNEAAAGAPAGGDAGSRKSHSSVGTGPHDHSQGMSSGTGGAAGAVALLPAGAPVQQGGTSYAAGPLNQPSTTVVQSMDSSFAASPDAIVLGPAGSSTWAGPPVGSTPVGVMKAEVRPPSAMGPAAGFLSAIPSEPGSTAVTGYASATSAGPAVAAGGAAVLGAEVHEELGSEVQSATDSMLLPAYMRRPGSGVMAGPPPSAGAQASLIPITEEPPSTRSVSANEGAKEASGDA